MADPSGRTGTLVRHFAALALALVGSVALTGCVGVPPPRDIPPPHYTGTMQVYGPTSLAEVLTTLTNAFKAANSGLEVQLTLGPDSQTVARATATGTSKPDVLVVEGSQPLAPLGDTIGAPVLFARNQLVVATAPGNPKRITNLADLARPGLRVVLCENSEPCGIAANNLLVAAGVTVPSPRFATDVRAALGTVEQGKADAALVYRTDTRNAGDEVATVEFPESGQVIVEYEAVATNDAPNRAAADGFLKFLLTSTAKEQLGSAGFQLPSS